jgi:DNA polymerase alpha subunit B
MDVNGTFDLSPLDRLLLLGLERRPDVLILMGPFIDAENEGVRVGRMAELPEALFRSQVMAKLSVLRQRSPHTKVILVPALGELTHDYSLPQCAYQPSLIGHEQAQQPDLILPGNPGTLQIGDFYLGVGTTDVLLRLGLGELQKAPQPADRFGRLAGHIYGQASYYPLLPAHEGANIEWAHAEGLQMPLRPDCLLMPSALKNFARPVQDALFVNPGQFCRKQGFGSAALLSVQPRTDQQAAFSQRCRVDMIQF